MQRWLQGRHILMFLDNAPTHCEMDLTNIELSFLPKNTTSATQPLDAGVIRSFKVAYRRNFLHAIRAFLPLGFPEEDHSERLRSTNEIVKGFDLLHAMEWVVLAWDCVKPSTIVNCFAHCGFPVEANVVDCEDNSAIDELATLFQEVFLQRPEDMLIEENLETSDEVDVSPGWKNRAITSIAADIMQSSECEGEELIESVDDSEHSVFIIPSVSEVTVSWNIVYRFLISKQRDPKLDDSIHEVDKFMRSVHS